MRVYVIGPVSGFPGLNREAFEEAARAIDRAGHEADVPHRHVPPDAEWADAMRASVRAMLDCDAVAMLDGWQLSPGARIERGLARGIGMPCGPVSWWAPRPRRRGR